MIVLIYIQVTRAIFERLEQENAVPSKKKGNKKSFSTSSPSYNHRERRSSADSTEEVKNILKAASTENLNSMPLDVFQEESGFRVNSYHDRNLSRSESDLSRDLIDETSVPSTKSLLEKFERKSQQGNTKNAVVFKPDRKSDSHTRKDKVTLERSHSDRLVKKPIKEENWEKPKDESSNRLSWRGERVDLPHSQSRHVQQEKPHVSQQTETEPSWIKRQDRDSSDSNYSPLYKAIETHHEIKESSPNSWKSYDEKGHGDPSSQTLEESLQTYQQNFPSKQAEEISFITSNTAKEEHVKPQKKSWNHEEPKITSPRNVPSRFVGNDTTTDHIDSLQQWKKNREKNREVLKDGGGEEIAEMSDSPPPLPRTEIPDSASDTLEDDFRDSPKYLEETTFVDDTHLTHGSPATLKKLEELSLAEETTQLNDRDQTKQTLTLDGFSPDESSEDFKTQVIPKVKNISSPTENENVYTTQDDLLKKRERPDGREEPEIPKPDATQDSGVLEDSKYSIFSSQSKNLLDLFHEENESLIYHFDIYKAYSIDEFLDDYEETRDENPYDDYNAEHELGFYEITGLPEESDTDEHLVDYKRPSKLKFSSDPIRVFLTYPPEDYDRKNEEMDPLAASAEWELEKRVEKMDVFPVELNKGLLSSSK